MVETSIPEACSIHDPAVNGFRPLSVRAWSVHICCLSLLEVSRKKCLWLILYILLKTNLQFSNLTDRNIHLAVIFPFCLSLVLKTFLIYTA